MRYRDVPNLQRAPATADRPGAWTEEVGLPVSTQEYVEETLAPGLVERRYPSGKIVYRSAVYADGKRLFQKWEGITRTEAKKLHRQRQGDIGKGARPAQARALADVMIEAYEYLDREAERGKVSRGTIENYRAAWRERIAPHAIAKRRLDQLDRAICLRFLRDLRDCGKSSSTQNGTVSALRNVLRYARDMDYMPFDPFSGIATKEFPSQKPSTGTIARALDNDEALRLIEAARSEAFTEKTDTLYTNMIVVARYQGARNSEVCGLRWRDVDLIAERLGFTGQLKRGQRVDDPVTILAPKNGEKGERRPRMFADTWAALNDQLAHERAKGLGRPDDLVFTQANGKPITKTRLLAAVRRAGELAGLGRVVPKDLRTSWVTGAAHAGMAPVEIAEWTGHTPEVVERSYVKPIRTAAQEEADMSRMISSGFASPKVAA